MLELSDILFLAVGVLIGMLLYRFNLEERHPDMMPMEMVQRWEIERIVAALKTIFPNEDCVAWDEYYECIWIGRWRSGNTLSAHEAKRWYRDWLKDSSVTPMCRFYDTECSGQATCVKRCSWCGVHKGNSCGDKRREKTDHGKEETHSPRS